MPTKERQGETHAQRTQDWRGGHGQGMPQQPEAGRVGKEGRILPSGLQRAWALPTPGCWLSETDAELLASGLRENTVLLF